MSIRSVCVYCGSSSRVADVYKDAAQALGRLIAGAGWTLVYGGGDVGLMGLTAREALAHDGRVVGIIPEHIRLRESLVDDLTETYVVDSMHERKQMMAERSDAFVVLPGGLGTLDEFFEILTWKQLGLHGKPIVVADINGYWSKLVDLIDHMAAVGFMRAEDRRMFRVVERVEDVVEALRTSPDVQIETASKWM